ncbi:MAG: phage/plasmid primase, P4 family [Desulfobacteraceae bacterium]|nr:phage/plasmid primase, P4 family [Desulfobacteraceae bacterium]
MSDKITDIAEIRRKVEERREEEEKRIGGPKPPPGGGGTQIDSKFVRACLRTNQHGDGELFKALFRGKFLFCKSMDCWLRWAGHHWEIDKMGSAAAAIEKVADAYEAEAASIKAGLASVSDKEMAKGLGALIDSLEKRANQLRGDSRRQCCLKFAHTSEDPLAIDGVELDSKPWLLPCANGVIELRTGKFRPGRPDDFLLKASPVEWRGPDAPRDVWIGALTEIMAGDADMVAFLQRLFGLAIVGKVIEKVFPVLTGPGGDNGKTTLIEGVSYALGPMAGPIPSEMLVAGFRHNSSGPSPDIMSLKGLRVAYASETEDGAKVSAAMVKLLTGKDSLTGRWPNDKFPITFEPCHTLFLLSNFKPKADSQDKAFWSRMVNIPFTMRFLKNRAPSADNERPADPHLDEKLKEQAPGILAWLVEGCLEWQRRGLDIPIKVRQEGEEYQSGEDDMGAFVEYCCFLSDDPLATAGATELYDLFWKWWKRFVGNFPPKQKRLGSYLRERFQYEKVGGLFKYYGISINKGVAKELEPPEKEKQKSSSGYGP